MPTTVISCSDVDCKNNKNGLCTLEEITIDECSGCNNTDYN